MNVTSVLVLILILSFAAERVAQAIMFLLRVLPWWNRNFPDPLFLEDRYRQRRARNRLTLANTVLVAVIAAVPIWMFSELHLLDALTGQDTNRFIDMAVTLVVVIGGSDIVGRLLNVSGIGEVSPVTGAGGAPGKNDPIEINGRLVLENDPVPAYGPTAPPAATSQIREA